MKTLYLDCSMGASGDMLAGALLDISPDRDAALAELNAFGVPGAEYRRETAVKCGLAATRLSVSVGGMEEGPEHHGHGGQHSHRTLSDVLHAIEGLSLGPVVAGDVARVYESLAAAESRAHGRSVGEVHFHEVGAIDAIADIAAFCHLLRRIAPDEVVVSPVHVGSGSVVCAHGILPVPAPAAAFLLEGVPTYSDGAISGELCTPTGAALIKAFATSFGPQPLMAAAAVGHGAGKADFPRANVVRAVVGERLSAGMPCAEVFELSFDVDDMTGEELAFASERIFAAGALDVSFAPVIMKKGRPGHCACVICDAAARGEVARAVFAHTSTLGVREKRCRRYELERRVDSVALADGSLARLKVSSGFGASRAKWEADDVAALARRTGSTFRDAVATLSRVRPPDPPPRRED